MITQEADRAFAECVREMRRAAHLTQAALAARVTAAGHKMHASTMSKIESVDRPVTIGEAVALAAGIGVPLVSLFERKLSAAVDAGDERRAIERQVRREIAAQILNDGDQS